jgi:hypothetical protein
MDTPGLVDLLGPPIGLFGEGLFIPSRHLYKIQILDIWPNTSGEDVAGLPQAASLF